MASHARLVYFQRSSKPTQAMIRRALHTACRLFYGCAYMPCLALLQSALFALVLLTIPCLSLLSGLLGPAGMVMCVRLLGESPSCASPFAVTGHDSGHLCVYDLRATSAEPLLESRLHTAPREKWADMGRSIVISTTTALIRHSCCTEKERTPLPASVLIFALFSFSSSLR